MNAPRTRVQRRPVHGVLLLDKPHGVSSNDALQKAKWLLRAEKAGHTGTLDPLATGVLPLCFGAATKFSQLHLDAHKSYEAVARLGATTTTGDLEGEVLRTRPVDAAALTRERLDALARQFTGRIAQLPPMYSALKKDGRALYDYARAGIEVAREPRDIEIFELKLSQVLDAGSFVAIKIEVTCSKGTYIRTLGEDLGEALGCGAHLSALRRTRSGDFGMEPCTTLQALEAQSDAQRLQRLLPLDALLGGHERVTLGADDAGRFLSGLRRRGPWADAPRVAVYGAAPPALLGTAHIQSGELIPGRLLNPAEIQQILSTSVP